MYSYNIGHPTVFSTFIQDHAPAASTGRSAAPQSATLRSCLKKQKGRKKANKKGPRHVQFAEEDQVKEIDNLKDCRCYWNEFKPEEQIDVYRIKQTHRMSEAYRRARQAALRLMGRYLNTKPLSPRHQRARALALAHDMVKVFRTLDKFSTNKCNYWHKWVASVDTMRTEVGQDWNMILGTISEECSQGNRQWAAHTGQMNAISAIFEYELSPLCIWTPPVVHKESLIKRLFRTNWNSIGSAKKRRRAAQKKCQTTV
jgi:hypothetical protein